ncbi:YveK family protein [Alkalibacter mobilis]|uniref:YveK family protein n=1 Tax=Alkalibacter mobilis TaxID=2787712 RepID=UPI00189F1843|nr:capsular biosynthesis protein [Alkalibacter mobilis]
MNLRRMAGAVLRKWWMIISMTLVGGLAGMAMTYFSPPVYDAEVTLYSMDLSKLQEEGAQLEYYDIELSREVLEQFSNVIYSRRVISVVQEQLSVYDLSEEEILSMVDIESSIDANIFYITARSGDPVISANVANAMAEQFAVTIHELLNTDNVGILDEAAVPEKPEPKNTTAMAFLGIVAGFAFGFSAVYLLEYFNPKVYSKEDLSEGFGLRILGTIPKYATDEGEDKA